MLRISSGWTLILRIFFPVIYIVFMLSWIIATIRAGDEVSPVFEHTFYKIGSIVAFFLMVLIIRYTTWKLRRLDAAESHIYITDYFKTYKYSLDSIAQLRRYSFMGIPLLEIKLKEKGSLGDKLTILVETKLFDLWIASNSKVAELVE